MEYCCQNMKYFVRLNKAQGDFDADDILYYSLQFDEYGIVVHDGGASYIQINYCPWCGKELPPSKRDEWFEVLEKKGFCEPLESEIPEIFKSDKWWKTTN